MEKNLWALCAELKENCTFVELSHDLSPETPHWSGFSPMSSETLFTYSDGFYVNKIEIVSQYGTHVDAPGHFIEGERMLHEIRAEELVLPLCVIDISEKAASDHDYSATVQDIMDWEEKYGAIPEESFVALRTDWSKREDLDNYDSEGNKHYPAWGLDAIKYLVEQRNVTAIGHETSDTDPAAVVTQIGFVGETYILQMSRYQIELMKNLDKVPPTGAIIVSGFPKLVDGAGFSCRSFAICPKK